MAGSNLPNLYSGAEQCVLCCRALFFHHLACLYHQFEDALSAADYGPCMFVRKQVYMARNIAANEPWSVLDTTLIGAERLSCSQRGSRLLAATNSAMIEKWQQL
jgi:hypothetical protein